MSSADPQSRPRQVTLAAWMIILGSVFVVFTVYEMVAGLRSLESREAVQDFLSQPPGDGLGISLETALAVMKAAGMVAAGCATAAAVLGVYVLRRNRQARVALTVLAAPLFLSGLVAGGFMSALVAAASVMLWLSPAREWFDGRPIPQRPDPLERGPFRTHDRPTGSPGDQGGDVAPGDRAPSGEPGPAERPFGTAPASTATVERPETTRPVAPERRPDAVVVAAILTWVFAGLVLLSSLSAVVLMAANPEALFTELQRTRPDLLEQGLSRDTIRVTTMVAGGIAVLWCAGAMLLAALMLGRRRWAAQGLIVMATLSAMVSLAAMIGSLVMVVPGAMALLAVVCLRQPGVVAWFSRARR